MEALMISIKKILVPVDFSEPSKKAVTYGLTLAKQFNARLILAHIVPASSALPYAFPLETFEIERNQEQTARREIQQLVPAEYKEECEIRTIVKTGSIDSELLGIVRTEAVDLVIMGTHGRRRFSDWFIGSVTERLLRKVPVPLLTVSHVDPEKHTVGLVALKRILYATDRFESSSAGLVYAIDLARRAGAHLTVMHAVYYADQALWAPAGIPDFDNERLRLSREIRKKIDNVFAQEHLQELPIDIVVDEGKPFEKILQIAKEIDVDIIVLNLQSKGTLERALLGATAERVVRLAPIPVLSIPSTAQ